jgi:sec-independent protein translocase protein TatB
MFDIGWSELLVIGSLALIVVGPKDLPKLLHQVGKYTAHARNMARDFQRSMEDAAREADISSVKELKDVARTVQDLKSMRVGDIGAGPKFPPAAPPKPAAAPAAPPPSAAATPAPAAAPVAAAPVAAAAPSPSAAPAGDAA